MINNQEHNTYITSSNGTKAQIAPADLSYFLEGCLAIGIDPSDFGAIIRSITNHVINKMNEHGSSIQLKKLLLFLHALDTFLSRIININ